MDVTIRIDPLPSARQRSVSEPIREAPHDRYLYQIRSEYLPAFLLVLALIIASILRLSDSRVARRYEDGSRAIGGRASVCVEYLL
jgi:hypothetical protein